MESTFPTQRAQRGVTGVRPAPVPSREERLATLARTLGTTAALGPVTYAIVGAEVVLQPADTAAVRAVVDRLLSDVRAWELILRGRADAVLDDMVAAIPADHIDWTQAVHVVTAVLDAVRTGAGRGA